MKSDMGLLMNIVLGIIGAAVASAIFSFFGINLGACDVVNDKMTGARWVPLSLAVLLEEPPACLQTSAKAPR
jgi:hypothetical protein